MLLTPISKISPGHILTNQLAAVRVLNCSHRLPAGGLMSVVVGPVCNLVAELQVRWCPIDGPRVKIRDKDLSFPIIHLLGAE